MSSRRSGRGRLLALLLSLVLLAGASIGVGAGLAQPAPFCDNGQSVDWLTAFGPLSAVLGDVMGEPVECPHAATDGGDTVQQTTTGTAILRLPAGLPIFTDGTTRWAVTDQGLVSWTGSSLDPPRSDIRCQTLPIRGFGQVFGAIDEAYGLLGCPMSPEAALDVTTQRFEHGWMVWRASRGVDDPATIFVLFQDDQHYLRFDDTNSPGSDPATGTSSPPTGLLQPTGGFGKIWSEATSARVRDRLGWAVTAEAGGPGATEYFERGALLWTPEPRQILLLAATTAERPQQVLQVWRTYADTFAP